MVLFLSDRLLNTGNQHDRADMVDSIRKGSVLAWKHINFNGEYDFTKQASTEIKPEIDGNVVRVKTDNFIKILLNSSLTLNMHGQPGFITCPE